MNKILLGVVLGAVLGFFDGLTAWFTPEARPMIQGILIGSTFKGLLTGMAAGIFARKYRSWKVGLLFGLGIGMILSFAVAATQPGKHYYFEIMLPGSILGAVVGFATQRFGRPPATA
jgi:hypothetical protein